MPEPEGHEAVRAGDRDRDHVVESLHLAYRQGRLSTDEYDDRVERTWAARTYGELELLTADLPQPTSQGAEPAHKHDDPRPPAGQSQHNWMLAVRGWFAVSFLNFGVWLVIGLNQGFDSLHPWWIWVAGGWGAALLAVQYTRQHKENRRIRGTDPAPGLGERE